MRHLSTAALIRRGDRLLFVRRRPGGDLGRCWELPGGKVDAGEAPRQALRRELQEELGVEATVGNEVAEADFTHRGTPFRLIGYAVEVDMEEVVLHEHDELAFCTVEEALEMNLAPSDGSLLRSLV